MEKSMPDLYKIRYKIGMSKKVGKVWTKYGKWSKMGVQSGPENQENVIKVEVWKVVEKVEKKRENSQCRDHQFSSRRNHQ